MPEADLRGLAQQLESILDRLEHLELEVRALGNRQTVEAKELLLRDERGQIRARLVMREQSPQLVFLDRSGSALLTVGLRADGSPVIQGRWQEMLLPEASGAEPPGAKSQAAEGKARLSGQSPAAPTTTPGVPRH